MSSSREIFKNLILREKYHLIPQIKALNQKMVNVFTYEFPDHSSILSQTWMSAAAARVSPPFSLSYSYKDLSCRAAYVQ